MVCFFQYDNFCFLFHWCSGLKGDTDSNVIFLRDIFGDFWLIRQRHSPWQVLYVLQASSSVSHWHFWRQHRSVMRKVCVTPNTENRICYAPFKNIILVWLFTLKNVAHKKSILFTIHIFFFQYSRPLVHFFYTHWQCNKTILIQSHF